MCWSAALYQIQMIQFEALVQNVVCILVLLGYE